MCGGGSLIDLVATITLLCADEREEYTLGGTKEHKISRTSLIVSEF